MSEPSLNGTALITGASTGIGAVYADRFAKRGYDLILVARSADQLSKFASELAQRSGRSVKPVVADLGNKAALATVEEILKNDPSITVLVNNAGVGAVGSVLTDDVDAMEAMIDLNITALTRLTFAAARAFVPRKAGTIINISSVVAINAEVMNGVYTGSKAYVLTFGHRLQQDLANTGVHVQTVLPGTTATPFWDAAGYAPLKTDPGSMKAEDLVDAALVGLDRGETVTIPPLSDENAWTRWERDRTELAKLSANGKPGSRYGIADRTAANA